MTSGRCNKQSIIGAFPKQKHSGHWDLPRGDVHGINVVAINERVELGGGRRSLVSSGRQQGQLLTFLELLQVQNGLGV